MVSKHDNSYRLLFSEAAMVADLLRGYVDQPWVKQLDFSTLEPIKADHITEKLGERRNDCIWRVQWQGGDDWLYVYLMLEFQSTPDRTMAVRLMTYLGLFYQMLYKTRQLTPSGKFPPVLPLVLYNGVRRWRAPTNTADVIEPVPGGLECYRPCFEYLVIDESRYKDDPLPEIRNLAAALFALENSQTPADVERVLGALIHWLDHPDQRTLKSAYLVWLKQVFLPARVKGVEFDQVQQLEEVRSMLAERVKDWTRDWERKGHLEGEADFLRKLLNRRFGPLAPAVDQRLAHATSKELERWGANLLDAQSLDEVFGERQE